MGRRIGKNECDGSYPVKIKMHIHTRVHVRALFQGAHVPLSLDANVFVQAIQKVRVARDNRFNPIRLEIKKQTSHQIHTQVSRELVAYSQR